MMIKQCKIPEFECKITKDLGNHVYQFICNNNTYQENLSIAKDEDFNIGDVFYMSQFELDMSTLID